MVLGDFDTCGDKKNTASCSTIVELIHIRLVFKFHKNLRLILDNKTSYLSHHITHSTLHESWIVTQRPGATIAPKPALELVLNAPWCRLASHQMTTTSLCDVKWTWAWSITQISTPSLIHWFKIVLTHKWEYQLVQLLRL